MFGVFIACLLACNGFAFADYVGAVAEHTLYLGTGQESPAELLDINLELYRGLSKAAKGENADILVFPEFGLTATANNSRESIEPFAQPIPSVSASLPIIPCDAGSYSKILTECSCMAKHNSMAILVNTIDSQKCFTADANCPSDGQFLYNTDVLFDQSGAIVAKYHKSHEWPGLKPPYDQPATPSRVTYKAPWGVEYGIFTCFDIMFQDPPVALVDMGIKHFLYPVQQGKLGEQVVIENWSKLHNVTILSANLGSGAGGGSDHGAGDCSGIVVSGSPLSAKKVHLKTRPDDQSPYDNILVARVIT